MKCFTIKAKQDKLLEPSFDHPMSSFESEPYPEPQYGIKAHLTQSEIEIAPGVRATLSPELLKSCRPVSDDPRSVIIERASLERRPNGSLSLVPEKASEENAALVLVDLGRGSYRSVRYEVGNRVLLRARRELVLLSGTEEIALVEVPVGRPFSAFRSSRPWYCFGGEVVGERLQIRFDGDSLKCEPAR